MQQDDRSGLLLAASGFASLSVGDAIVKTMAGEWSPLAVAALRFSIGAMGLAFLLFIKEGRSGFRPSNPWLQVGRGACLAGATLCFFSAIFAMPLATAMALAFVSPVFVAILSGPLLGEKVRPLVWVVSAIALCGVALILRPNLAALGMVALLPLASAASSPCSGWAAACACKAVTGTRALDRTSRRTSEVRCDMAFFPSLEDARAFRIRA